MLTVYKTGLYFNEASFSIQNIVQLSLKIDERVENKTINIIAVGNPPFSIQLNWNLANENGGTAVTFTINAELNMMMKMMAAGHSKNWPIMKRKD